MAQLFSLGVSSFMSIATLLMDTAVGDSQLYFKNLDMGDRPEIPRDIDFCFYAKNEERAKLVASFVTDYRYGIPAAVERIERQGTTSWRLIIKIHTPMTENVIMALSGFMVCLADMYDLDYDGWGCIIQK